MKFKINYNFKGGTTSSTSSSSVPKENGYVLMFLGQPNNLNLRKFEIKGITSNYNNILTDNLYTNSGNHGKNIHLGWIFESELDDPKFKIFKDNYKIPYKIFISLKIPINNGLMDRWNICKTYNGQIQSPHITLARLNIKDNPNLIKLLEKKDLIQDALTSYIKEQLQQTTGQYKILGKDVPDDIKYTLFEYKDINNLEKLQVPNNNTECYLSRVLYIGDFVFLYDSIHEDLDQGSFFDYNYYNEGDYQNFTLHISLAKFGNINQALIALKEIYNANLLAGFDDIFKNPNYFNIQIS